MTIFQNVLELIGNTPMLQLHKFDTGPCELFMKMESLNPGGSIKDRIGLSMIEAAEQAGDIKPGDTLVEATAGNTGLGLALVAKQKGYKLLIVMPDKMSQEKVSNLRAMDAKVIITRSDVEKGHPSYYQDLAKRLAKESGGYFINQFANPANVLAHKKGTGPEIWQQMQGNIDALVVGVGSGGTLSGLGAYLKEKNADVEIILADPKGSILAGLVNSGKTNKAGKWLVEGIGEDFVPSILDLSLASEAFSINDQDAFACARALLRKEGIIAGSSTGVLLETALRYCRKQTQAKRVVTLAVDTGNKYLSKLYNDNWLLAQGLLSKKSHDDLRDLINRPHDQNATVVVGPDDVIKTAYMRINQYDVSQLPVIDGQHLVGMIDEALIMKAMIKSKHAFEQSIKSAMGKILPTLQKEVSIKHLAKALELDPAVYIMDGLIFLGVITRIDLVNHFKRESNHERS